VSTSRIGTWLAAVAVVGGLVVVGGMSWEGWDGRVPESSDPRLLAEGSIDRARWAVLQVDERDQGLCLHLRQDGVLVDRRCRESRTLRHYAVGVVTLRGASRPIIFGVLPDATVRAQVVADAGDPSPRFRDAPFVPLRVRTFGESGRFVVEPAPADAAWRDRNGAPIEVSDAGGRTLTP
jgi:hypothetical protein